MAVVLFHPSVDVWNGSSDVPRLHCEVELGGVSWFDRAVDAGRVL